MILESVGDEASETLAKIHEECFPTYWNIEAFNDFFSVVGTHAIIARIGEPVGMIVYRVQFDQADIITLAVLSSHRRQGIAKALLEEALADIKKLGGATVFLDVEEGNDAAVALYETHGFSHERRRKLYYRQKDGSYTDALVMKKKIA